MKDRRIYIRVSEEFLKKLEYLMMINGFKTLSETIRKIVEKEYRKEQENG
jgi:metal-responsive CopG/Arc/MetJ family transcriptional regulator